MLKLLLLGLVLVTWRVTDVVDIAQLLEATAPANGSLRLSPDGTKAAWGDNDSLCVYTFADASGTCTPWPEGQAAGLDLYSPLTWSPDSTAIAYTENFFTQFREPDVWVFDVATATFTNRTPDDQTRVELSGDDDIAYQLDYAVTWGLQGELYFVRTDRLSDDAQTGVYRLDAGSDTPTLIRDITDDFPRLSLYFPPALSPDGARLAFIILDQRREWEQNGVWTLNLADGAIEPIATLPDLRLGFPEWQPVESIFPSGLAWAGDNALIVELLDQSFNAAAVTQNFQYVDLETRAVTPLVDLSDIESMAALVTVNDGQTPLYRVPRIGVVGDDTFFFAHYDLSAQGFVGISAVALPVDGSTIGEPTVLYEDASCPYLGFVPPVLSTLTASNQGVFNSCLVTFAPS